MSTIPKAAIDAALAVLGMDDMDTVGTVDGRDVEAAILAALPHMGEPVAWAEVYGGKIETVRIERNVHHTVPLYLVPPSLAPVVRGDDEAPDTKAGPFARRTQLGYPPLGWTCFHCGETFTTQGSARDHFGCSSNDDPACRIKIGEERGLVMALRKAEAEISRLCSEERDYQQFVASSVTAVPPVDEVKEPTLNSSYTAAIRAAEEFYDVASYEETQWTGWGDQIVPPYSEMRRVKAKQALDAIRDADPRRFCLAAYEAERA